MGTKKSTAKKKVIAKRTSKPAVQTRGSKSPSYRPERGIALPPPMRNGAVLTPERRAIEALRPQQSFLVTDKAVIKRTRDIIYRIHQASRNRYTLRRVDDGWRVWRLA